VNQNIVQSRSKNVLQALDGLVVMLVGALTRSV
jgi:hypothetical protein